eukprot:scaffold15123_cov200-Alexandrium_tamarense.AAC.3
MSGFEQYMKAGDRAKATSNFDDASKLYEKAIDCLKSSSQRHPLPPIINLATCLRELARYNEAEQILMQCLGDDHQSDVSVDDPLYAKALTTLAALYQAQSKYEAAKEVHEKAVSIARNIQKSRSNLMLAENIAGYAESLRKSGDLSRAEEYHREALEIRTCAVEKRSCTELELAVSYTQLGCTLSGMGKDQEAYAQHHLALGLRYRYLDFSHGLVSESLNYCAESLCALGRGGEGIPLALHAVDIRKAIFGTSHPAYAHTLSVLASCYHAVGRFCDARDLLEQCLEICEVAFQQNHANIIPNLMNYGEVLRSTGDLSKAKGIFERAIAIHELNFNEGQQASQLEKCKSEVAELEIQSLESSIHCTLKHSPLTISDVKVKGTPVVVFTDIGRDVDDELALVSLSCLRRRCELNPVAVITTLSPEGDRAQLARGLMDILDMADVPVGIGSAGGVADGVELEVYDANYVRTSQSINEDGMDLVYQTLESAPPKSVQVLCLASMSDVATMIRDQEILFTSKVKEVVIMGGVQSMDDDETLSPDTAYNNNCDMKAARFVYDKCQALGVPTATLSRWAAYGCPIRPLLLDELAKTDHMSARNVQRVSKQGVDQLWNKVILPESDLRREKLPGRCDVKWFYKTFIGKWKAPEDSYPQSIWPQVQKLNMYDPLAVLLCIPAYRRLYFDCKVKVVNGVSHVVVGTSEADNGIVNPDLLYNEYASLFFTALQRSLHKQAVVQAIIPANGRRRLSNFTRHNSGDLAGAPTRSSWIF